MQTSDLNTEFRQARKWRPVVKDLSLIAWAGESTAIVGESGSGKTVTALSKVPGLIKRANGCHFNPRCAQATEVCLVRAPQLLEYGAGHYASCHLLED